MISNFIFHFVFAIFTVWAGVAWFLLQNRLNALRNALVPLLCLEKIEFPKHRSLFVRALKCLEEELSIILQVKVKLKYPTSENVIYTPSVLQTFCLIFNNNQANDSESIKFENDYYNLTEFNNKFIKNSKVKNISFVILRKNNHQFYWQAEISRA